MVRIAVVDDESAFVDLVSEVLAEVGWETISYPNTTNLLPLLREEHPAGILLDVRLSTGASGWDLLTELKLDPILCQLPVIVCSAASDELQAKAAWMQAHGVSWLEKPFEIDSLEAAVADALARRASTA